MKILAIDTATEHGSVALVSNGELIAEHSLPAEQGHGSVLFTWLHQVSRDWVRFSEIDVFAAGAGPGSFTGVRVALATAKGLAEATGKGAVGVSNLQALATYGTGAHRAALIDARKNECYAAIYNETLDLISAEMVADPGRWLNSLPDFSYQFVSQKADWLDPLLAPTRFAEAERVVAPLHIAPAIARCAALQIERGASTDPLLVDANYVRRSDANLFWHDR